MGKFINPFTDFGFKHIFGREMDKDILIEFLNDLLEGEHTITELRIMNDCPRQSKEGRSSSISIARPTRANGS